MMLIGSKALEFWDSSFRTRDDSDWDVIGAPESLTERGLTLPGRVEYHKPESCLNGLCERLYGSGVFYFGIEVCSPKGLMIIKRSHLWRNYKFDAHITQYHKHLLPLCKNDPMTETDWEHLIVTGKHTSIPK